MLYAKIVLKSIFGFTTIRLINEVEKGEFPLCKCGYYLQPKELKISKAAKKYYGKCCYSIDDKPCDSDADYLSNVCKCQYCSECAESFINMINEKSKSIFQLRCICKAKFDLKILFAQNYKLAEKLADKCKADGCDEVAIVQNYDSCYHHYCNACIRDILKDNITEETINYKALKCTAKDCGELISPTCVSLVSPMYVRIIKKKGNSSKLSKWTSKLKNDA